ncbi:MAG: LamB/YcsF family protein [Saprospiraceae bacterium]|nr:LamB/YcsF family protein [Saprospiraceae bacterium]
MEISSIDINCDLGESYGNFQVGNDAVVFPYLSSCNIACGFHGGDPLTIINTIESAKRYGVTIGAHPSYPDLQGFGRRKLKMPAADLAAAIQYQVGALQALCLKTGMRVRYVKPHGALYNTCFSDMEECRTVVNAIKEMDDQLMFMGLANSLMASVATELDVPFIAEAFADRRYTSDGKLQSRRIAGSVITTPEQAVEQVRQMLLQGTVTTDGPAAFPIEPMSICIHGDNHAAEGILMALDALLTELGIEKKACVSS